MAGSLSVASTAVSPAKVAVVDSNEVGRSAVYNRYNRGEVMKYTVEMGSGVMIYIPNFIETDSGIQKLTAEIRTRTNVIRMPASIFFENKESRLKYGAERNLY
jgi:hypothetical protein